MGLHTAKHGLDLPINGTPNQKIESAPSCTSVAIMAADFHGMKPKMLVQEGDSVKRGQKLFEDRKNVGVFFTAPGAGTLKAINRGAKRALQSIVIEINASEKAGEPAEPSKWSGFTCRIRSLDLSSSSPLQPGSLSVRHTQIPLYYGNGFRASHRRRRHGPRGATGGVRIRPSGGLQTHRRHHLSL